MIKSSISILFIALMSAVVFSSEVLKFDTLEQKARFEQLTEELRCPKCLNQSIADSNAGISEDLRNIVYEKVLAGHSNQEIKAFLQARYGEFILYEPPVKGANLVIWYGPILLIVVVIIFIAFRVKKKARDSEVTLSIEDSQKIQQLLSSSLKKEK